MYRDYPNRTICDVLEEMRKAYETRNFSYLLGHIEEAQSMATRMEAGLSDKSDVEHFRKQKKKLVKEIKELEETKSKLKGEDPDDDNWSPGPV